MKWKDSDTVTTTFGTIKRGMAEAAADATMAERQRILAILDDHYADGSWGAPDKAGNPVPMRQTYYGDFMRLIEDGHEFPGL
jgi:hypothetical protein